MRVWSIAKPIPSFFSGLLRVLSLGKVEPLEGEISQKHLCVVTPVCARVCVCVCLSDGAGGYWLARAKTTPWQAVSHKEAPAFVLAKMYPACLFVFALLVGPL